MTIAESGWNVWVWLVGVVSKRWVWLVGVGGIYGCGCKEVYIFPHSTYPYSSCICSFLQQHPYFLFIFLLFFVLVPVFFKLHFMYLIIFSRSINTHSYLQLRASHGIHMKAAHTVLYMNKHTQMYASYPAMDISCMSVV